MGRCVISALGEMLISVLSAATWMDEPAPPTPPHPTLQHPAHLPLGVSGPTGHCRGDACDQQVIVYLPVPPLKAAPTSTELGRTPGPGPAQVLGRL